MRVWLVTAGEPLPVDPNPGRPMRTWMLARYLAEAGNTVVWWSSTFNHTEKIQRFQKDTSIELGPNLKLELLHAAGYESNVSLNRMLNHRNIARRFRVLAEEQPLPDVILCSLPTLEFSAEATAFGQNKRIPVVIDVRDLWPDLFVDLVPTWLRIPWRLALTPFFRSARSSCRKAAAITGPTPGFVDWGLRHAGRPATPQDRDFPFAYPDEAPNEADRSAALDYWKSVGVEPNPAIFRVCYFGAIGRQAEFEVVVEAARRLERQDRRFQFVLCGQGDRFEEYRRRAQDCPSVLFPGFASQPRIWTLLRHSNAGIAPFFSTFNYTEHIPNKIVEYLSGGLPILSSLKGTVQSLLAEHHCGLYYENGNAEDLVRCLCRLQDQSELRNSMSMNAKQLFDRKFTAGKVCADVAEYLMGIVRQSAVSTETSRPT